MNQDGADISLRDALAANSQVRSMAPAALALALELSRKWFRPLFGKLHSLQIQHGYDECR